VSVAPGSLGAPSAPRPPLRHTARPVLPSPVEYAGKPADRFWEFEDASVHFGVIDAGPTDLTRVLLLEFSLVYGNDWYVVPLRLPVGSLFRVTSFTLRDTFGVTSTLTRSQNTSGPRWSMFDLASDQLFLPSTLAQSLSGPPIEQVQLTRDESANLAWASNAPLAACPATRTSAETRCRRLSRRLGPRPTARLCPGLPRGQFRAGPVGGARHPVGCGSTHSCDLRVDLTLHLR